MSKISLKDKIAIDAKRTTGEERNRAILFREGKFFRAFNYSAWLLSQYIYNEEYRNRIGAVSPISVTRNKAQGDTDYIMCGFPIHSIEKYSGGLPYEAINDEQAVITLPEFALSMTEEEYAQAYADYSATIVAKPKKSEEQRQFGTSDEEGRPRSLGMIDIIRKVNNYAHTDRHFLHHVAREADTYLRETLHLGINKGKTHIINARHGVEFLGAYIKPHRTYISNQSLRRMRDLLKTLNRKDGDEIFTSVNSFLGVLRHYRSYSIRKQIVSSINLTKAKSRATNDYTKLKRWS